MDENEILLCKIYTELCRGPQTIPVLAEKLDYRGKKAYQVISRRIKRLENAGLCKEKSLLHLDRKGPPTKTWIAVRNPKPSKNASKIKNMVTMYKFEKLKTDLWNFYVKASADPWKYKIGERAWNEPSHLAYADIFIGYNQGSEKETKRVIAEVRKMRLPQSFANYLNKKLNELLIYWKSGNYDAANRCLQDIKYEIKQHIGKDLTTDHVSYLYTLLNKI